MARIFVGLVFVVGVALGAAGCAPKEWSFADDGAYDPLEGVNRAVFGFNAKADAWVLRPVAQGYGYLPSFVRTGVGNVFGNLQEPRNVVNGGLQLRGGDMLRSAGRFVVNSTGGVLGLFDVATHLGLQKAEADFGQTFRTYGFDDTAHLVLPFLGPSTFADAVGSVGDSFADPTSYLLPPAGRAGLAVAGGVHRRHGLLQYDSVAADALDPYIFVRDIYEERRRVSEDDDEFGDDDFGDDDLDNN